MPEPVELSNALAAIEKSFLNHEAEEQGLAVERNLHKVRVWKLFDKDGQDLGEYDNVLDAYLWSAPGDTLEEWVKSSAHVVLEGEYEKVASTR